MSVTISNKYQVVVPKNIRKLAGLRPGQKVTVSYQGGKVILEAIPMLDDIIEHYRGTITANKTKWGQAGIDAATWIRQQRDTDRK